MPPPLDSGEKVTLAALKVDPKDSTTTQEIDGKDRMSENVLDAKDGVQIDPKDAKDAPVFALATSKPALEPFSFDLMGPDGIWGNLRTTTPILNGSVGTPGGPLSDPPIGTAVPEPSTLPLLGLAGALAGVISVWRRRQSGIVEKGRDASPRHSVILPFAGAEFAHRNQKSNGVPRRGIPTFFHHRLLRSLSKGSR